MMIMVIISIEIMTRMITKDSTVGWEDHKDDEDGDW